MRIKQEKIILGIDPGTNIMGYGLVKVDGNKASMLAMGVIDMRKIHDPYLRLGRIFDRVTSIIEEFLPDEMAIEAPFFGKNVQSMLKLGRAQGVAIAAAISRQVPIAEYEPRKIKQAITGNGAASKEQVRGMLMHPKLDSTDALGAALCHYYESSRPQLPKGPASWKEFAARNPDRIKGL